MEIKVSLPREDLMLLARLATSRNEAMRDTASKIIREYVAAQQSMHRNRQKDNATGFKGVTPVGRRFGARIQCDGQHFYLGTYDTPEEAAHAYNEAAVKYFGEFAKLNFE